MGIGSAPGVNAGFPVRDHGSTEPPDKRGHVHRLDLGVLVKTISAPLDIYGRPNTVTTTLPDGTISKPYLPVH
jgi:hypothetical protein